MRNISGTNTTLSAMLMKLCMSLFIMMIMVNCEPTNLEELKKKVPKPKEVEAPTEKPVEPTNTPCSSLEANNNPGGVMSLKEAFGQKAVEWQGCTGVQPGKSGHAVFESLPAGKRALMLQLICNIEKYKTDTPEKLAQKWCPNNQDVWLGNFLTKYPHEEVDMSHVYEAAKAIVFAEHGSCGFKEVGSFRDALVYSVSPEKEVEEIKSLFILAKAPDLFSNL